MDINNCLYDRAEEVSLPEFYEKYRKSLPMLVMVLGGYDGTTEYDDTPSDTIIRYSKYQSVRRALALDPKTRRNYISIPVNCKHKFSVIKSHATKKDDHTLAHILDTSPLPVLVQFSETREVPPEGRNKDGQPYQFLLTHVYDEVFIQGNFITEGKITKQSSSFSLCPLISVAPVKGFTNRTQKEYDKYLQKLEKYVNKNTVFSESQCDMSIKELPPEAEEIKEVLTPKENKTSDSATPLPPPPPVRGKSLKKTKDEEDDEEPGAYEVMEKPKEDIDTYHVPVIAPSYVNDRLCRVKPQMSAGVSGDQMEADDSEQSGGIYEPMADPDQSDDYLEPTKKVLVNCAEPKPTTNDKDAISRDAEKIERSKDSEMVVDSKASEKVVDTKSSEKSENNKEPEKTVPKRPVPLSRIPPKPKKKPEKLLSYENSLPFLDNDKPPEIPTRLYKDSDVTGDVQCSTPKPPCSFCIEEKSIQDIVDVLGLLKLSKYAEKFQDEMVDGEILAGLSVEDLQKEFGFSKLEALRLYRYIEKGHVPK